VEDRAAVEVEFLPASCRTLVAQCKWGSLLQLAAAAWNSSRLAGCTAASTAASSRDHLMTAVMCLSIDPAAPLRPGSVHLNVTLCSLPFLFRC
jgi:hypothetical protein